MATLTDNPSFTANEVYEIQATDQLEGAATGASYGGIGLSNQQAQQLANRTAVLKNQQVVNVANIAAIQAFDAQFAGSIGQSGYLKIPYTDVNRGAQVRIEQWGFFSVVGYTAAQLKNTLLAATFPIAFPNACLWLSGTWVSNATVGPGALSSASLILEAVWPFATTQGQFFSDWNDTGTIGVAQTLTDGKGFVGFCWRAIGY